MIDPITTDKGYTLTLAQMKRRDVMVPHAQNGPDYRRGVRDNLMRLHWSEDHEQADYYLTRAEACMPGAPVITATIRTTEPASTDEDQKEKS